MRGFLADGVDVVQAGGVQVDDGGARRIGCVNGRQPLVVQAVGRVVLRGEDAAAQTRDQELLSRTLAVTDSRYWW